MDGTSPSLPRARSRRFWLQDQPCPAFAHPRQNHNLNGAPCHPAAAPRSFRYRLKDPTTESTDA